MNFVGNPTNLISDEMHRPTQGGTQFSIQNSFASREKRGQRAVYFFIPIRLRFRDVFLKIAADLALDPASFAFAQWIGIDLEIVWRLVGTWCRRRIEALHPILEGNRCAAPYHFVR